LNKNEFYEVDFSNFEICDGIEMIYKIQLQKDLKLNPGLIQLTNE